MESPRIIISIWLGFIEQVLQNGPYPYPYPAKPAVERLSENCIVLPPLPKHEDGGRGFREVATRVVALAFGDRRVRARVRDVESEL
jgi:hypothetical protein